MRRLQLRTQREYEGAEDGFVLAGWLRLSGNTREGRQVIKLIRDLHRLMTISPKISAREEMAKSDAEIQNEIAALEKLPARVRAGFADLEPNKLARRIDARLKSLFQPPTFLGFTTEDGRMRTLFTRLPKPKFPRACLIAEQLENLGKLGLLDRIRQCRSCGLWIFARFERERFCSGPCREKAFRASPEGKKKRRDYMRGYRERLRRMQNNHLSTSAKGRG